MLLDDSFNQKGLAQQKKQGYVSPVHNERGWQGQLPVLPMVPVVALGNMAFQLAVFYLRGRGVFAAPVLKAALLYAGTQLVLDLFALPAPLAALLSFMMSWPQIVTGVLGLLLAHILLRRTQALTEHDAY